MSGLALDRVSVVRRRHSILRDVTVRLDSGGVVAICGPNGAGKSTLVQAIAGQLPHDGSVRWDGRRLRRDEVAYMPQSIAGRAALSVLEVVLLGRLGTLGWHVADAEIGAAAAALAAVGLADLAARRMDTLSGGQQQLVHLAQRLAGRPRLLLLDEPTSALDARRQLLVLDLLADYARDSDALVVTVMHDLSLSARYARSILLLHEGALIAAGAPDTVLRPETMRAVYGIEAEILRDSAGNPVVAPLRAAGA